MQGRAQETWGLPGPVHRPLAWEHLAAVHRGRHQRLLPLLPVVVALLLVVVPGATAPTGLALAQTGAHSGRRLARWRGLVGWRGVQSTWLGEWEPPGVALPCRCRNPRCPVQRCEEGDERVKELSTTCWEGYKRATQAASCERQGHLAIAGGRNP